MKRYRRWMAGLLAAVIMAASLSSALAAPADTPFAEFRFDASELDQPNRDISINIYRRGEDGQFQVASSSKYSCTLNRATGDARFFVQANRDNVWVSVDYLTDLDGDGVYELLEDPSAPVWDVMDTQGRLSRPQPGESAPVLASGQPYLLASDLLVTRSRQAVQDRAAGGSFALGLTQDTAGRQDFPLCMVKLHYTDPAGGEEQTLVYYLQIYGDVLVPFDLSPSDPYYDAVLFVLSRGYFSGSGNGLFQPNSKLPRAQMAQVLWTMAGSPAGAESSFSDVPAGQWFYPSVSWCQREGLIAGYSSKTFAPSKSLSREQMMTILFRYANYTGAPLGSDGDLSRFSDAGDVSSWARDGMQWAAANGLLVNSADGTLRPQELVTRWELAAVLYAYSRQFNR